MNFPRISAIAAISENRGLGKDNKLIWHISSDLKRFKQITQGHVVVMGRKTYESMGRALPNRINIIISRDTSFSVPGSIVVQTIDEAISKAKELEKDEIFIIGGGQIYSQTLPMTDRLYLTVVKGQADADVFFPDYSSFKTVIESQEQVSDGYTYTFLTLEK